MAGAWLQTQMLLLKAAPGVLSGTDDYFAKHGPNTKKTPTKSAAKSKEHVTNDD